MSKVGRPKKGTSRLPDWFDIEKYKPFKNLDAQSWLEQILVRRRLMEVLSFRSTQFNKHLKNLMMDTRKNPIINFDVPVSSPLRFSNIFGSLSRFLPHTEQDNFGVLPASNFDIKDAYQNFPIDVMNLYDQTKTSPNAFNKADETLLYENADKEAEAYSWLLKAATIDDGVLIKVDLNRPDSVLIDEFKSQITELRKLNDIKLSNVKYRSMDFLAWYNSGALPYMDLRIWEEESKSKFNRAAFAMAMGTIARDASVDGALKTTKIHARLLSSVGFLELFGHQVHKELNGTEKKSLKFRVK